MILAFWVTLSWIFYLVCIRFFTCFGLNFQNERKERIDSWALSKVQFKIFLSKMLFQMGVNFRLKPKKVKTTWQTILTSFKQCRLYRQHFPPLTQMYLFYSQAGLVAAVVSKATAWRVRISSSYSESRPWRQQLEGASPLLSPVWQPCRQHCPTGKVHYKQTLLKLICFSCTD